MESLTAQTSTVEMGAGGGQAAEKAASRLCAAQQGVSGKRARAVSPWNPGAMRCAVDPRGRSVWTTAEGGVESSFMTNPSGRSGARTDAVPSAISIDVPTIEPKPAHEPGFTARPPGDDENEPPKDPSSTRDGRTARDGRTDDPWENHIRDAARAGKLDEATRCAFLWLRKNSWMIIRAEARRRRWRAVDESLCQDVAQEVLRRLCQMLSKSGHQDIGNDVKDGNPNGDPGMLSKSDYQDIVNPGGLLRTLVRRTIDAMHSSQGVAAVAQAPPAEPPAPGLDPEQQAGLAQAVRDCIRALTVADRLLFDVHLTSIDAEEAAGRLHILVNAFYGRLMNARRRLKLCLQEKGYTAEELRHGIN